MQAQATTTLQLARETLDIEAAALLQLKERLDDRFVKAVNMVLAGQGAPANANLRLSSHWLASSPLCWYGLGQWVRPETMAAYPACLNDLPVLLPTRQTPVRAALDRWFDAEVLMPAVVGELQDGALMAVVAARGLGVVPVSVLRAEDLSLMPGFRLLGQTDVKEDIHVIYSHRTRHHPLVQHLLQGVEPLPD